MSENMRTYVRALYGFDATVQRAPADSWGNPSPCAGWTAADVVAHNVGMNRMVAGFTGGEPADHPGHPEIDDPVEDWAASFEGILHAFDRYGALHTVARTPWGEMPVDSFLGFAWVDPLIHTWDLARATGQEPVLYADLVERGATQLESAGDSLVGSGWFEPAVQLGDDASTLDRFVAFSGRDPGGS